MTQSDLLTDIKLRTFSCSLNFMSSALNKFENIDKFQFSDEEENLLSSSQYFNEINEHHLDEISEMFTLYSTTISSRLKLTFKIIYFTFILI